MSHIVPRGSAHVSARALLEHPRKRSDDSNVVVFDALIHSAEAVNGSNIFCCSLQYILQFDAEDFEAGLYDIFAKVRFFFCHCSLLC